MIAEKDFLVLVNIDHENKIRNIDSGIVEKGAVLPEMIDIVPVIHANILIAREDDQSAAKTGL